MPALSVADLYQKRAARVGFDWPNIDGVYAKLSEEVEEMRAAKTDEERFEEFGDVVFALVNLARWYRVDAESALRETNEKFRKRFGVIEAEAQKHGRLLSEMTLEEMDTIWEKTKRK